MSRLSIPPGSGWKSQRRAPPIVGWHKRLRDGTVIHLRPIDRHDADLEMDFLHRLSPAMRDLRFLGLVREPCPDVARGLTDLDHANAAGFIALVADEGRERQIGAAHFHANPAGDSCDCSVTVSDEWQQRGVGSALMRLLIDTAKSRGIRHMRAFAPAQSDGRQHLAMRLGFQRRPDLRDAAVVVYSLDLK